jgi:photosystem II stability/assembly factor-like uncharacterized protein
MAVLGFGLCAHPGIAADLQPRMLLLDAAVSGREIVVVGERGTILRSTDSAQTWNRVASGTRATLTGIAFAPGFEKLGWAVGHDALILSTADGGSTWTKQYQGADLQDSFLDVLALVDQRVIAIGGYGLYAQSTDGGKTWTRRKIIDDDAHLNRITFGADGWLYLAGEHGTVLRSRDRGETWQRLPVPYDGSFYGILASGQGRLIAYGSEGRAFRSIDDGATWTPLRNQETVLLASGVLRGGFNLVLAGQSRSAFELNGDSLSRGEKRFRASVAEIIEMPDGNILAVGEAGAEVLSSSTLQPLR